MVAARASRGLQGLLLAPLALALAACASPQGAAPQPEAQPPSVSSVQEPSGEADVAPEVSQAEIDAAEAAAEAARTAPVKVGLLLPLSGRSAAVGQSLLNAAQLALFDLAGDRFTLVVQDTGGNPEGAAAAAEAALASGAVLILGPLFSTSVEAVKPLAAEAQVPLISFSNNTEIAGPQTFVMGVTPRSQVDRVVDYAVAQGLQRFAVLAPETRYGTTVVESLREAVFRNGVELSRIVYFDPLSPDVSAEVRALADYDERAAALKAEKESLEARSDEAAQRALARLKGIETLGPPDFDSILIPSSGQQLLSVAPLLAFYDVDPSEVRFLGTALWDDPSLLREPSLRTAWFPAPSPAAWGSFKARYRRTFDRDPPRVASLAYDAVALAAVLERRAGEQGSFVPYSLDSLTQPVGFSGIDGIFRFLTNGQVQRGLSVLELQPEAVVELDPAPTAFDQAVN